MRAPSWRTLSCAIACVAGLLLATAGSRSASMASAYTGSPLSTRPRMRMTRTRSAARRPCGFSLTAPRSTGCPSPGTSGRPGCRPVPAAWVDGIPLALELGATLPAGHVGDRAGCPARSAVRHLDRRLAQGGLRRASRRFAGHGRLVMDLLNVAERHALARLSVFAGGSTCGPPRRSSRARTSSRTIGRRAPRSAGRQRMLHLPGPAPGPAATGYWRQSGKRAARQLEWAAARIGVDARWAHFRHYLALAQTAVPGQLVAHDSLLLAGPSPRSAGTISAGPRSPSACSSGDPAPGIQLVAALRMFWEGSAGTPPKESRPSGRSSMVPHGPRGDTAAGQGPGHRGLPAGGAGGRLRDRREILRG